MDYNQKREEGHLISGYHSPEMSASQWSEKAGIQCSQEYPIFYFLFQLHGILNNSPGISKQTNNQ